MNRVILLAEDSVEDAELIKRTLQAAGVKNPVRVVRSGEETISYLKGEGIYSDRETYPPPKLLLLDLLMPDMDGWGVLDWLRLQPRSTKKPVVVVLTGPPQKPLQEEAYDQGADSFIVKPLVLSEVESLIRYWPAIWKLGAGG